MTDTNQSVQEEKANTAAPVASTEAKAADEQVSASNCSPSEVKAEEKKAV